MYKIIAPTLFHEKICRLPGIGTLKMVPHSAVPDFVNGVIRAPYDIIEFDRSIDGSNEFNEFSAISELLQNHLNEKGNFLLDGIGTFIKSNDGEIAFDPYIVDDIFTPEITAERVIRQDASHNILVGDQQTTSAEMTEYFSEEKPVEKDNWWIWAIVLGAVGVGALLYYFLNNGTSYLGNIHRF